MLRHIDQHAADTLVDIVAAAPVRHLDVLDPTRLGVTGRAARRPVPVDPITVAVELRIVDDTADSGEAESATEAALAALAGALGVVSGRRRAQLVAQTGEHAMFVGDCCIYLDQLGLKFALIATPAQGSDGGS